MARCNTAQALGRISVTVMAAFALILMPASASGVKSPVASDTDKQPAELREQVRSVEQEEREKRGRWLGEVRGPTGTVVAFSDDGNRLLTGGGTEVCLWDTRTLKNERVSLRHGQSVCRAEFGNHGSVLTAAGDEVRVWNDDTGKQLLLLQHRREVLDARFSRDGSRIVTGCADALARVWDSSTGRQLLQIEHPGAVQYACFSPNGAKLLTLGEDNEQRRWADVWDVPTGSRLGHRAIARTQAEVSLPNLFSPDSRIVVTIDGWGAVLWEPGEHQDLRHLEPRSVPGWMNVAPWEATFSPDGRMVAMAAWDGVLVWDVGSGKLAGPPLEYFDIVHAVFSPDGSKILTAGTDTGNGLWDLKTGREILPLPGRNFNHVAAIAFSPDGKRVAVGYREENRTCVWKAEARDEKP